MKRPKKTKRTDPMTPEELRAMSPQERIAFMNRVATHKAMRSWLLNTGNNFEMIRRESDFTSVQKDLKGTAVIVGGGPSLGKFGHLDMLRENFNGTVLCGDRLLVKCLEHGVIPKYFLSTDPHPWTGKYVDHKIIDEHSNEISAIFGCTVHPSAPRRFKGKRYWFIPPIGQMIYICPECQTRIDNPEATSKILNLMTGKSIMDTMGNVSGGCWMLASYLGKQPIAFIGQDLGWPVEDFPSAEDIDFSKLYATRGLDKKLAAKHFDKVYNPYFKNTSWIEESMGFYRDIMVNVIGSQISPRVKTINCTGSGNFFGPGIEQMHLEDFLKEFEE